MVTFCFNYLIIIVYCFVDINTYVGDEPPQQDERLEEEVFQHPIGVWRPAMPRRLDRRVCIELASHMCALFSRKRVPHAHVREIREDPHLLDIWCTLPHHMMTLMHHVVSALMFIQSLQAHT